MKESENTLIGAIEALLFMFGEPIDIKKLSFVLEADEETVQSGLDELRGKYENENSGLELVFSGKKVQLATKPKLAKWVEKLIKEDFEENLTPAALETLSLIAYLGPISRPKVDYLRGVNSSYTIRNLSMRGLIEKVNKDSHIPLYGVSFELIKDLGISTIENLPDYQKYRELINSNNEQGA